MRENGRSLVTSSVRSVARPVVRRMLGRRTPGGPLELASLPRGDRAIVQRAVPYTVTGIPRLVAVIEAVRYCISREISGAFAECGVWRGGSVLAMVLTLQALGVTDREVYLYDTFTGMTEPTERDTSAHERPALATWRKAQRTSTKAWPWLFDEQIFNEAAVRETILSTGYPEERVHFVAGKVEDTLPEHAPSELALLRLDTDWYESTRHELLHLYPRLTPAGVLIIDDYGHWKGAKRAVDEYFADQAPAPLLTWIDYTCRVGVKT